MARLRSSVLLATFAVAFACGGSGGSGFTDDDAGSSGGPSSSSGFVTDSGSPTGCKNLECNVAACPGGGHTTISGTAFAPNGTDPLYNVIAYVPNADLQPFPAGVTCDKCGAITSGEPIVTALSDASGKFQLVDVPSGDNVPVVLQVGRWRRKVVLPHVASCADTALSADDSRLPRNQKEGDIPLIALATSPYDPEECILKKIGIDVSEFTIPTDKGRVHVYKGAGATLGNGTTPPASSTLWATAENLKSYDIVMLPCQTTGKPDTTGNEHIKDYADNGGRVFITDLSEDTIMAGPTPWPSTATFGAAGSFTNPGLIDTSFPKGQALADWLEATGATTTKGQLQLVNTFHRFGAASATSQRWIYSSTDTQTYSFNTPVEAATTAQCGRVVYSSFHVATNAGLAFPSECNANPLTPQEKALEFLLFDLAACIQKDDTAPTAPPVK